MRCLLYCLVMLLLPGIGTAGNIIASSVEHEGGHYTLSITARINAPLEVVYDSITDFDNLAAINPAIETSRVLGSPEGKTQRVHSVIKVCILMFCKRMIQVQDVTLVNDRVIEAVIVPQASDFRSGFARWQLTPHGTATELLFTDRFEPDFWVPPVIGPWLIKRKLMSEVAETAMYIEARVDGSDQ